MWFVMVSRCVLHAAIAVLVVLSVAACGGGGGGSAAVPSGPSQSVATPTPTPTPPTSVTGSATVGTQPSSTSIPSAGGYTGTLQFPAANAPATLTVNTSTGAPAGAPVPQAHQRQVTANTPLLYFTLTSAQAVTLAGSPGLTLTLPAATDASQKFYLAALLNQKWTTFNGPGAVTGNSVTFSGQPGSVALSAGTALDLVFYAGAPLGSDPLSASPSSAQLLAIGDTQTITLTDVSLPPAFAITNSYAASGCAGIASAASSTGTDTWNIGAVAAGTCTMTFADAFGNTTPVSVTVTTTSVVAQ